MESVLQKGVGYVPPFCHYASTPIAKWFYKSIHLYGFRKAVNLTNFSGDIGGSMGLFMGMSIITLAEIFIFIFKIIWGFTWPPRGEDLAAREEGLTAGNIS